MNKLLLILGIVFAGGAVPGITAAAGDETATTSASRVSTSIPALHLDGYARETLPGAAMSAAYLSLRNTGSRDLYLQSVELPGLEDASADLHTTVSDGGISRMRALTELAIPPGEAVVMAPGGVHLMLRGIQLRAGEQLPLRLHFAGGQVLEIRVPVMQLKAAAEHHHHG